MSRQIVLDTETTGLNVSQGHRIIEIGGVEILDRRITGRHYHQYFNPERGIEAGALEVHGINEDFLADKPRFAEASGALIDFIAGAELVIHNAAFDVGFLDRELARLATPRCVSDLCSVLDTLAMARELHPGQRNSLDALCSRYAVDNSGRQLHGALLDAEILAEVYLAMTGGQVALDLAAAPAARAAADGMRRRAVGRPALCVVRADEDELRAHAQRLAAIDRASDGHCVWLRSP